MAKTTRWGILGTGKIARKFTDGLKHVAGAQAVAVGSRAQQTAEKFADEFGIARRHASYEALASDGDVDAIYVATPHSRHIDCTILCLAAGKAVLCEKPFAINAGQAEQMVHCARDKKVFLMEAMWTRFLPHVVKLRELLSAGAIGEVRMVTADFGFRARFDPAGRLFDPELGGGALLDVGIYPVSLAHMVLGCPSRIVALAELGQTGVDEQSAMILGYEEGRLAVLFTAVRTRSPHDATIIGAEGFIRIDPPWWRPSNLTIDRGGKTERVEVASVGNGYNYEAEEVGRCLAAGKLESDVIPLDESVAIMKTLDTIRAQWGLKYPMEA